MPFIKYSKRHSKVEEAPIKRNLAVSYGGLEVSEEKRKKARALALVANGISRRQLHYPRG